MTDPSPSQEAVDKHYLREQAHAHRRAYVKPIMQAFYVIALLMIAPQQVFSVVLRLLAV